MPGIIAYLSKVSQENSVDFIKGARSTLHHKNIGLLTKKVNCAQLGLTHINKFESSYIGDFDGTTIILDGYLCELPVDIKPIDFIYDKYIQFGIDFVKILNGSFNILIYCEKDCQLFFASDRYGTRPMQWSANEKGLFIAPEAKAIFNSGFISRELNLTQVANQLSLSRVWLDNNTFFKGISVFPAATILTLSDNSEIKMTKYWEWEHKPTEESEEDLVDECVNAFKVSLLEHQNLKNVGISLSGGLDSRMVLAAGLNSDTFTWGYSPDNDEIKLAKEVADVSDSNWTFIKLSPTDFLDSDVKGTAIQEGLDMFVQSYALYSYPQVCKRNVDYLMTGLALDFTMAGSYLPVEGLDNFNHDDAYRYIIQKSTSFTEKQREDFITNKDILDIIKKFELDIVSDLSSVSPDKLVDFIDSFFMENRVRRCIFQRQTWQRLFVEDLIPTFDNRIVNVLLKVPFEMKAGHSFFCKVLKKLNPKMMDILYQGTMLPPSTPVEYWGAANALETQKESLYRDIFYKTDGEIQIPYNRYYSNFDEWLRCDCEWQEHVSSLILVDDARINQFVDPNTVRLWYDEQKSGKKAHFGRLIQLVSLEKLLRKYFD